MSHTILCIEDQADNMMLIRRILQWKCYSLLEAGNGLEGVAIAENQDVDLILLDINLPDIDGYEVARRLRASHKTTLVHTPIIALTANAMRGDAQKVLDAGCNLYISKPINMMELLERVESFLTEESRGITL